MVKILTEEDCEMRIESVLTDILMAIEANHSEDVKLDHSAGLMIWMNVLELVRQGQIITLSPDEVIKSYGAAFLS